MKKAEFKHEEKNAMPNFRHLFERLEYAWPLSQLLDAQSDLVPRSFSDILKGKSEGDERL